MKTKITFNMAFASPMCLCASSSSSIHQYGSSPTKFSVYKRRHNKSTIPFHIPISSSSATPGKKEEEDETEKDIEKEKEETGKEEEHKIPQSSIDWNQQWTEFQASGGRSTAPPGREPIPKQVVVKRKLINRVRKVQDTLPSRQKLFSDWRFWLCIILSLSLFTAFINSTSSAALPQI